MKKVLLPVILGALGVGFWLSPDFQEIAAGVAIFLFGMLALENGFRQFTGGMLERVLERSTNSVGKALAFGVVSTTLMQSSTLVSVITISFLSAGLISLLAGIGIVFGANIGTTTGAWLVAGVGLKVKISAFAMPMLAFGVIMISQRSKQLKGIGYILAGLGFLFLGIHFMKEGFETFKDQFDLTRFAMTGLAGLAVYTFVGTLATVVMHSSHAAMVVTISALASGQISYENALALAIGANVGTTVTAVTSALASNYQGKRLALAHLIFNLATAAVALVLIDPLRDAVDLFSELVGIADGDFALKLAAFHTVFNVIGVLIMLPGLKALIRVLERAVPEPALDISKPRYLTADVDEFPATIEAALRNEVRHLYENAVEIIAHGLNLHRDVIFQSQDLRRDVFASRKTIDIDLDRRYEERVKVLYAAIMDFTTRIGATDLPADIVERVYRLREVAGLIVRSVKSIKHLRKNVLEFTTRPSGAVSEAYNELRLEIARILVELEALGAADPEDRTSLWLDEERMQVENAFRNASRRMDALIRSGRIDATDATSYINDSGYAYEAMRNLIQTGQELYVASEPAMAEVERILTLEEEDIVDIADELER